MSLWINDQVIKCELSNDLVILDNSPAYERLMERADYFLMTSRLDPLPNVSIDAMFTSTPMLCFQKACGMASLMSEDPILRQNLIAEYLDTNSMAEKVIRLLQDTNAYRDTARRCQLKAIEWFNMHNYIEKIKEYGEEAIQANKRLSKDFDYLIGTNEYDKREFLRYQNQRNSLKEVLKYYLISWKNQIWARKPLGSPGIYKDEVLKNGYVGSFVHYLKQGKPEGKWKVKVIEPKTVVDVNSIYGKVALHIHVHYKELLKLQLL